MSGLGTSPNVKTYPQIYRKRRQNSSVLGTETSVYIYSWNNLYLWEKESFVFLLHEQVYDFYFVFWLIQVQNILPNSFY